MKRIIVAAILMDGEKILLGKKAKGKPPYPDVWHVLGGGIEDLKKRGRIVGKGRI